MKHKNKLKIEMSLEAKGLRRLSNWAIKFLILLLTTHYLLLTGVYSAGETSANFLKIPVGVRNVGMGETGAACQDINSVYYNPGGLGWLDKPELTFTHDQHFQGIYYEHIAAEMPIEDLGTFGLAIYYLGMDNIKGYDANGKPTSNVSAYDSAVSLSYGRYVLGERIEGAGLSVGGSLKYIYSKLDDVAGNAVAVDIGAIYVLMPADYTFNDSLAVGLSAQNIGTKIKYDKKEMSLPLNVKFGAVYSFIGSKLKPVIMLDINKASDSDAYVSIGGETWIKDILALRAGYITKGSRDTDTGIRFGIGVKSFGLSFDYAYSGFGDLGTSHRFGLTLDFEMSREMTEGVTSVDVDKIYNKGMDLYEQGRYLEATLEFNKVLKIDPTNKAALDMMKKANAQLHRK